MLLCILAGFVLGMIIAPKANKRLVNLLSSAQRKHDKEYYKKYLWFLPKSCPKED